MTGLVLLGNQPQISRQLPSTFESMRIIDRRQLDVEFAFPEFMSLALGERFATAIDQFASALPGAGTGGDRDGMIGE